MLHSITIGGASDNLPLFKHGAGGVSGHGHGGGIYDKHRRTDLVAVARRYIRSIVNDKSTRNVFFFLLLNISFTGVEFAYGWWTGSLGLTADAVHMLFDSTALIFSLIASVIAKWERNERFTYGYGRVETMTGFVNALALLFASWNIMWEACERLYHPEGIERTTELLIVSILGLLWVSLRLITAATTTDMDTLTDTLTVTHTGTRTTNIHMDMVTLMISTIIHTTTTLMVILMTTMIIRMVTRTITRMVTPTVATLMVTITHTAVTIISCMLIFTSIVGMFLHILSDTLGSVGVIISSILIQLYGWQWTDPLCSLFIAIMTIISLWPLLKGTGATLLQRVPEAIESQLAEAYRKINMIEGVSGFSQPHFWEVSQGNNVGTIKIQMRPGVHDEDHLRMQVAGVFQEVGVRDMVVQTERGVGGVHGLSGMGVGSMGAPNTYMG
ncbi:hypothetical protein PhCBS80983_g03676 [Powellomyces hirtus]|uniref:Cation efflux protein transmembrane domain-containing protein n=1 Tax=Powellomyces hirtus TaxID=109895 RepID=A0A507E1G5_9FUNG|nr:hypothetical protein PhCBS80983_g03676 [Powellomyces hirtus]